MNANFSLLIKPASYSCNLRCAYCFYLEKKKLFRKERPRMTPPVLERMISSFMALNLPQFSFGWQGGEPTLMGLDFFKRVVELQQIHGRAGSGVANGLQTNGTRLDDEFCEHLGKYKFLVGISIDGPPEIHDAQRVTHLGRGSHHLVMRGLTALKRHHVEHNGMCLVTQENVGCPALVYNYLKELGINFHQYIECVEFDEKGDLLPFAVGGPEWGDFLCGLFDEWKRCGDERTVSVRLFDSIIFRLVEEHSNVCAMADDCRQYFLVEHNGDVYPCDFHVLPEWRLGSVMTDEWVDMFESELFKKFGARKHEWNEECEECPYLMFCAGCCPKNRPMHGLDPRRKSVLCEGWKQFFKHSLDDFKKLARGVKRDREIEKEQIAIQRASVAIQRKSFSGVGTTGRNDPCPCGSGRKFKKCCGK